MTGVERSGMQWNGRNPPPPQKMEKWGGRRVNNNHKTMIIPITMYLFVCVIGYLVISHVRYNNRGAKRGYF